MIFAPLALFSVSALVAANEVDDLINDFTKIAPSDTAAFTLWRSAYENSFKSYIASSLNSVVAQGVSTADIASLKSSIFSVADSEMTENYEYFSNQYYTTQPSDDYDFTTDAYATGDNYETAFETGDDYETAFQTGDDYETALQTDQFTLFTTNTATYLDYDEQASTRSNNAQMGADTLNPLLRSTLTKDVHYLAAASNNSHLSSHSSASHSSTIHTGLGEHQTPMIVGAILAGISVLLL